MPDHAETGSFAEECYHLLLCFLPLAFFSFTWRPLRDGWRRVNAGDDLWVPVRMLKARFSARCFSESLRLKIILAATSYFKEFVEL